MVLCGLGAQSQLELIIALKQTLCTFHSFVFCLFLFIFFGLVSNIWCQLDRKQAMAWILNKINKSCYNVSSVRRDSASSGPHQVPDGTCSETNLRKTKQNKTQHSEVISPEMISIFLRQVSGPPPLFFSFYSVKSPLSFFFLAGHAPPEGWQMSVLQWWRQLWLHLRELLHVGKQPLVL